jgi:two-component system, LuxR family, response regulator FixJ
MEPTGTVHLVDDENAFLTAMSRLLRIARFAVAAYPSGAELLSHVSSLTRGCVVADLDMPGISGLELQQQLSARGVTMPVVFLTAHGDIPTSVSAMRGGAVDFLEKLAPREQVLAAITRALRQDAASQLQRQRLEERRLRFATLTAREREVLVLVASGKMNKQIGAELGIHERTVKLHRTSITNKLNVDSTAQLAVLASEAGLVEPGRSRR